MAILTFIGAGSTVFAKNVLGDCMLVPALRDADIRLVDIDPVRLRDSEIMVRNLSQSLGAQARVSAYLGSDCRAALSGADYVVNAIQVGGYEPCTVTDFEIPKRYGLEQTIGDTLGIGGIFRALRTIPVLRDYCRVIEEVAPSAWLLNYTNPMCMVTGAMLKHTGVRCVGLCHSVQVCATQLCEELDLPSDDLRWKIAGINHQAWLLEITRHGADLYPEIKRRALLPAYARKDAVRFEIMKRFGYYVTESSEHSAEYVPWFIKRRAPELIEAYGIPLDEYPRRCVIQIERWREMRETLVTDKPLEHCRGHEYASYMLEAMETNQAFRIAGNVLNKGYITNLPEDACVEVLCLVDGNGIQPVHAGALPPQCAALNRTNINVQELTIEAAHTLKRDHIYQAALLDPHTAAELTVDEIVGLCDDLIAAHGDWLPHYT
jgi:alpha-galactosidase